MHTYYERTSVRARRPGCGRNRIEHPPIVGRCVVVCIAVSGRAGSVGHQGSQRHRYGRRLRNRRRRRRRRPPGGVVAVSVVHQGYQRRATTGRRAPFRYGLGRPPRATLPIPPVSGSGRVALASVSGPLGAFYVPGYVRRARSGPSVSTTPAGGNPNHPHRGKSFYQDFRNGLGAISPLARSS